MRRFDLDHLENITRVISREMVAAGLPEVIAPTPARQAAERIRAGEPASVVIADLVEQYRGPATTTKAEPAGPEPMHVRMAREAGKVAPAARTTADRVKAALEHGNPWATGNRTHQALVAGLDPDQAAHLKRDAGK